MGRAIASVRALLIAIFVVMAGGGFITTLVSFRLERAHEPAAVIGIVATSYFIGLMVGSSRVIPVIRQVGHIRTFAAAVSILSASTLIYSLGQNVPLWTVLRFVDGICMASVFVCLESWLNDWSEPSSRGTVLGVYMVALYFGQAAGQFLLNAGTTAGVPFILSSILVSLAVLPVTLTKMAGPSLEDQTPFSLRQLYATSPLGVVGVGATGVMIGSFYAFGVVYAQRMGLGASGSALFMGLVIGGGVALQWPLGWLSDRFDRRRVIVGTFAAAAAVCALLTLASAGAHLWIMSLGTVFGGLLFALYPLCAAHTNDWLQPSERVSASGGLILIYSAGAAVGPLSASVVVQAAGAPGLFMCVGAVAILAFVFGTWRLRSRAGVPGRSQQPFQALPRTTGVSAVLTRVDAQASRKPSADDGRPDPLR
ncbi:MFS transporter [Sphingomonas sp. CLY1604]|uniref:MFS transporter n=1 Tax=Sphingomonas sp. CLY1604 TaxID=3457786 RepID=UPI003FD82A9B